MMIAFVIAAWSPLLGAQQIELGHVFMLNWTVNKNLFADVYGTPVNRMSTNLFISCKDSIPATIHLLSEDDAEDCDSDGKAVAHCPLHENSINLVPLHEYPAGTYYVTSFSTRNNDGREQKNGGFCAEGIKYKIVLEDGKNDLVNQKDAYVVYNIDEKGKEVAETYRRRFMTPYMEETSKKRVRQVSSASASGLSALLIISAYLL